MMGAVFVIFISIGPKIGKSVAPGNKIFSIKLQKSTFYYNILIGKKFQKNYMEHAWQRDFEIPEINWENVYYNQVWDIKDKKLGELKVINYFVI